MRLGPVPVDAGAPGQAGHGAGHLRPRPAAGTSRSRPRSPPSTASRPAPSSASTGASAPPWSPPTASTTGRPGSATGARRGTWRCSGGWPASRKAHASGRRPGRRWPGSRPGSRTGRKDWAEKVSTRLVRDHDLIVFEKLNTKEHDAEARAEAGPGSAGRVPAEPAPAPEPGSNRGILASCWGLLARRTEQKAAASGAAVVYVDPKFTSQECRACGHVARENRESQAVFRVREVRPRGSRGRERGEATYLPGDWPRLGLRAGPGARGVRPQKPAKAAAGTTRRAA